MKHTFPKPKSRPPAAGVAVAFLDAATDAPLCQYQLAYVPSVGERVVIEGRVCVVLYRGMEIENGEQVVYLGMQEVKGEET